MTEGDTKQINGEVVAILDDRELIMSVGPAQGVAIGQQFVVLGSIAFEAANRELRVEYPKTIVKIVRILDHDLSVGRTFRTIPGRKGREPAFSVFGGTPDIPPSTETIDTGNQETVLDKKDTVVRVGDPVRLTTKGEFPDPL